MQIGTALLALKKREFKQVSLHVETFIRTAYLTEQYSYFSKAAHKKENNSFCKVPCSISAKILLKFRN